MTAETQRAENDRLVREMLTEALALLEELRWRIPREDEPEVTDMIKTIQALRAERQ